MSPFRKNQMTDQNLIAELRAALRWALSQVEEDINLEEKAAYAHAYALLED